MDGRAFYENVKSFCQCRGGAHVNVQQQQRCSCRRETADAATTAAAAAATAAITTIAIAQNRFTQAAGQSIVGWFEQTLQRAEETIVCVETIKKRCWRCWTKVSEWWRRQLWQSDTRRRRRRRQRP